MENLQKVNAVQDESSHWYIIPNDLVDEFFEDNENEDLIDSGEFDRKWEQYMTGGDLNLVQLYADLSNLPLYR
jgi:hypothetical protein